MSEDNATVLSKTDQDSNSTLNDVLVCPQCGEEYKIPPVITGSICYGCRFRDDKIKLLTDVIKQIYNKLEREDVYQFGDDSELFDKISEIAKTN